MDARFAAESRAENGGFKRPKCDLMALPARFLLAPNKKGRRLRRRPLFEPEPNQELALSTVTERRFCDQQEMSLHTATGRSLP
jgi:hypothetical protein